SITRGPNRGLRGLPTEHRQAAASEDAAPCSSTLKQEATIFLSEKRHPVLACLMGLQRSPLVWPRGGFFEPKEKAKYLDEDTLGLEA
ncbi:MAG: hypothetical protein WBL82_18170, partial [Terriglobales bacterium]